MLICIPCISNLSDVIGTIWWLPTNHSKQWFLGHSLIRPNSSKRKQDDRSFDIDVPTIYLLVQNWALQWSRKILLTLLFFAVVLKMPLKLKQLTFQAQQNKKRKHFWWSQDLRIKRATTMKFKLEEFNSTIFHFQATFKYLIESVHSYVEHSNWYQNLT